MSSPPRQSDRRLAPVAETPSQPTATKQQPLSQRLPTMSDYQLSAYQASANRISRDPEHPKTATATKAIPLIEAEIRRRADALRPVTGPGAA